MFNQFPILFIFCLLFPAFTLAQKNSSLQEIAQWIPSNLKKAEKLANQYLKDALDEDKDSSIALANYALGLIYYYQNQHIVSANFFQNALNQDYAKVNIEFSEKCQNNLGVNYEIIGKLDLALSAYQKSLKLSEKRKDSFGIAQTWINIALLESKAENYRAALQLNQKARNYFLKIGDEKHIGLTYLNASLFYFKLQAQQKAIENALMGKKYFENIKDTLNLIKIYLNLSNSFLELEKIAKADLYYQNAKFLGNLFESHALKLNILSTGIELNLKKNNFEQAKILFYEAEKILAIYPDSKDNINLPYYKVKLSAYDGNKSGFEKAIKEYENYNKILITDILNSQYEEWKIIYEKEELTKSILQLTALNKFKNKTIFINSIIIVFLIIVLIVAAFLYLKLRSSYRKIFQLNQLPHTKPIQDKMKPEIESNDDKIYLLFSEIQHFMENEKFYLKPGITISDLSTALGTNDKYISSSINKFSKMNFNQYINLLRVQEAKKMLLETNPVHSVQEIAIACGFGNSSSFIRAFKFITGLTPSYFVTLSKEI